MIRTRLFDSKVLGEGLASRRKKQAAEARQGVKRPAKRVRNTEETFMSENIHLDDSDTLRNVAATYSEEDARSYPIAHNTAQQETTDMHLPYASEEYVGNPGEISDSFYYMADLDYPLLGAPKPDEARSQSRTHTLSQRAQSSAPEASWQSVDDYNYYKQSIPVAASLTKLFRDSASSSNSEEESSNNKNEGGSSVPL